MQTLIGALISFMVVCFLALGCGEGERRVRIGGAGGATLRAAGGATGATGAAAAVGSAGTVGYVDANDSSFLFDDTRLHRFSLGIAETDRAWMEANGPLEEYVPATLTFNDQVMGTVGVRYKGSDATFEECWKNGTRVDTPKCAKLSLKLKLDEYVPETRLFGLKRINLHGMRADVSALKERLAYRLFRDMGVETSRVTHARVTINGEFAGLYALVEDIDGRFTADRWPEAGDGNLYKEWWWGGNSIESFPANLETNTLNPDASEMLALHTAIEQTSVEGFVTEVAPLLEVDDLVRYMVADRAIANVDGITRFWANKAVTPVGSGTNHNYYVYQKESGGRFTLIPWDLDLTFDYPDELIDVVGTPNWNVLPADCTANFYFWGGYAKPPACDELLWLFVQNYWGRFVEAGQEFLDGPFQLERMQEELTRWEAQIALSVAEDPHIVQSEWRWGIDTLRSNLPLLIDRFEGHLQEGIVRQ